jgi:flagellar M-ring protein FliF
MADAKSIPVQIKEFWQRLTPTKRWSLIGGTVLTLAVMMLIAFIGSRITYAPLYTELETQDAAAIVEKLKELNVPHRVSPSGTTISVPEEQVHELRLELASAGLPRGGGVGFEIFDQSRLGATEFEQQINLRRALEGELSRSIGTIDGVQSARVHLVMPERRLFAAKSESASASVILKLRPGREFGRREVGGIVHLVTAAVPALSKDRVSVVSTDGLTLHQPDSEGDDASPLDDTHNQQARDMAQNMESHVRTLLERIAGFGRVDVRVNVELQKATRERMEEHYEPTKTALRSEHKTDETTTAEGASVAGVPGAQTNLPDIDPSVAPRGADTGGGVFRRTQTRNWEVDRITEKTNTPSGGVARLTVAVLIDGRYEPRDGTQVYEPRDPEELKRLEEVVKNAVGFTPERGDTIRVEGAKFLQLDGDLPEVAPSPVQKFLPFVLPALGLLAFLIGGVVLLSRRRKSKKAEAKLNVEQLAAAAAVSAAAIPEGTTPKVLGDDGEPLQLLDTEVLQQKRASALEIASRDPATTAIVLSEWLSSAEPPAEPRPDAG